MTGFKPVVSWLPREPYEATFSAGSSWLSMVNANGNRFQLKNEQLKDFFKALHAYLQSGEASETSGGQIRIGRSGESTVLIKVGRARFQLFYLTAERIHDWLNFITSGMTGQKLFLGAKSANGGVVLAGDTNSTTLTSSQARTLLAETVVMVRVCSSRQGGYSVSIRLNERNYQLGLKANRDGCVDAELLRGRVSLATAKLDHQELVMMALSLERAIDGCTAE